MTDTTANVPVEPSPTAGEAEMLLFALDRSRAQLAWKCGGLDAEALRRTHPPSTMTLAGLLKHLALVDDHYCWRDLGEPMPPVWDPAHFLDDPDWEWHSAPEDAPEDLHALWAGAVERSRAAWARAIVDGGLDRPSRFTTDDGFRPNLRRVLVDLQDEYARHVGHADLLREAIDGLVGEDPPQAG